MGAEQDGVILFEPADQFPQLDDLLRVKPHCRLVQNQKPGMPDQGLGKPNPLAVAFGKVPDQPFAHPRKVQAVTNAGNLGLIFPSGQAAQAAGKGQLLLHRHIRVNRGDLRQIADPFSGGKGIVLDRNPFNGNFPA